MNKILNYICHKISPLLFIRVNTRIKKNFSVNKNGFESNKKELLFSTTDITRSLIIKDESWNQIKYIGQIMWNDLFKWEYIKKTNSDLSIDNYCDNTKVTFDHSTIYCKSNNKKNDWVFLKFPKVIKEPFLVEFDAKILSENTEFQFAFNYKRIGERYRFNLKNNKELSFEVVYGGFFHNSLISVPFSLDLNKIYNFKISISSNVFSYVVDNTLIMSVKQKSQIIGEGELVFILWDSEKSNINTIYQNINIFKI